MYLLCILSSSPLIGLVMTSVNIWLQLPRPSVPVLHRHYGNWFVMFSAVIEWQNTHPRMVAGLGKLQTLLKCWFPWSIAKGNDIVIVFKHLFLRSPQRTISLVISRLRKLSLVELITWSHSYILLLPSIVSYRHPKLIVTYFH